MKCRIKKNNSYFNKNIGFQNHWTYRDEAKIFDSVEDARKTIKLYKMKNVEIEKTRGNRK